MIAREFPQAQREAPVLSLVMAALGSLPDLTIWRNQVQAGKIHGRYTKTGLGEGSADLVGMLHGSGRWFCIEVKRPGERPRRAQREWLALMRSRGAFATWVDNVEDALAAYERAKAGENE